MTAGYGVGVGEWTALVRRARIGRDRKGFALLVASYANPDGTSIHPSVTRLAVDYEVGYSTARRYLAWMRAVGLIELVRAGSQARGLSDEYRLILHPDVLEHLEVPTPAAYDAMRQEIRDANRAASAERTRRARAGLRSPRVSAEACGKPAPNGPAEPSSALTVVSAEPADLRSDPHRSALTQSEPPPIRNTSPKLHTSPTTDHLRTDLTVVGRPQAPASALLPVGQACQHHPAFRAGLRHDGKPRCDLCRTQGPRRTRAGPTAPAA